ncbi:MAG: nicotinate-nucleotide adenylyltransferase [Geminicoccaceae bacterium]
MADRPVTARRPVMRLDRPRPAAPVPEPRRLRVGLLGGSFNPAHDGHLYISLQALHRLGLDQVWWLVSPQNPLKPVAGMAPLADRMAGARAVARHPRLRVLDLETRLGTRYTIDTLRRLGGRNDCRFVWLIGADNLRQLPRWRQWRAIMAAVPIAVFERPAYSYAALAGPAAGAYAASRIGEDRLQDLVELPPPAWAFVRVRAHGASSTAIRRAARPARTAARREEDRSSPP